jgi:hypothetical protein
MDSVRGWIQQGEEVLARALGAEAAAVQIWIEEDDDESRTIRSKIRRG